MKGFMESVYKIVYETNFTRDRAGAAMERKRRKSFLWK